MARQKSGAKRFGTNAVTGLNVSTAPHLIADHELVSSIGGWTDQDGAWRTGRDHVTVHSGSAISAMAIGRMGDQDHTVYVDGNGIYDTGSLVGTVAMGASPSVVAIDRKFLILGSSDGKNKMYDGDHVRDHGAWKGTPYAPSGGRILSSTASTSVTAITKATSAVLTVTSSATFAAGYPAYITGVVGMTEINGRSYLVTAKTTAPDTITLGVDSTNFSTYTSGGTIYDSACGLDVGDYRFAMTTIVELGDGSVIESALIVVGSYPNGMVTAQDSFTAYAPTAIQHMSIVGRFKWAVSSVPEYNITGTIGTDYKPGVRIYRTKVDGTVDFYLEKEFKHGDTGFTYTAGANATYSFGYSSYVPDEELGALYAAGQYDHGSPPQSSLAAQVGQRVFLNDVDNPERVYVSGLDGSEYFAPTDWLIIPGNVTLLSKVRDRLVVGTANRFYLVDMISGFPQVQELDTSVGVLWPDSASASDQGLFFVRPDGIFQLDLVKTTKISRRGILDADLAEGYASIVSGNVAIFVCDPQDAGSTAVACIRDNGWVWHTDRNVLQHTHLAKNSVGQILGSLPTKIETLFLGTSYQGELTGKTFSDGETWRTVKLLLDVECTGAATAQYNVTTNYGPVFSGIQTYALTTNKRRIVELPLARTVGETFYVTIVFTGNVKLYGYAIEVEEP